MSRPAKKRAIVGLAFRGARRDPYFMATKPPITLTTPIQYAKGVGETRAAQLAARFAFEKAKLIRAEIVIAVGNERSKRVAEKIGAHYEGILLNRMVKGTQICDAYMFSLIPSDFELVARL